MVRKASDLKNGTNLTLKVNDDAVISNVGANLTGSYHIDPLTVVLDSANIDLDSVLLHLTKPDDSDQLEPYSESLRNLVDSFIDDSGVQKMVELNDFFDKLLVSKPPFIKQIQRWKNELGEINSTLNELLDLHHPKQKVHKGMIIFSATDDIEDKVISHYGGVKWKRIMHFIRGGKEDVDMGKRGGSEFVSLTRSNIYDHSHDILYKAGQNSVNGENFTRRYYWLLDQDLCDKSDTSKTINAKLSSTEEGLDAPMGIDKFHMRALLSQTNLDKADDSIALPHLNLPTYINCYIWECVQAEVDDSGLEDKTWDLSFWEQTQRKKLESKLEKRSVEKIKKLIRDVEFELKKEQKIRSKLNQFTNQIKDSIGNVEEKIYNFQGGKFIYDSANLDDYFLLLSEKINKDTVFRYESELLPISELANLAEDKIFEEILQLDYLTRGEYQAGIQEVYALIYSILVRMRAFDDLNGNFGDKFTVQEGQYIFIYDDGKINVDEMFILPDGCIFEKVSSCFFRGSGIKDSKYLKNIGSNIINIYKNNLPPHRHTQGTVDLSMVGGNALGIGKHPTATDKVKLNIGELLEKGNDLHVDSDKLNVGYDNGIKMKGLGEIKGTTKEEGNNQAENSFKHNNIPPFIVLSCYRVVLSI